MTASSAAQSLARSKRSIGWTLAATCFGFALIQLDVTIVNVALPAVGRDLGTGVAGLQWVVDAYALVFASFLLAAGSLSDRFGAKPVYLTGMVIFTLASLGCGLAVGTQTLIAARALQGIGAAAMLPASLTLLNLACGDDARLRGWAIGWWASCSSIAIASGPILGGVLVGLAGWRSIFLVNVPIGLLGGALLLNVAGTGRPPERRRLDWLGQVFAMLSLGSLTAAVIEAEPLGWRHPAVFACWALALVAGGAFVLRQRRGADPILPGRMFRAPIVALAIVFGAGFNVAYYGMLFVLSLYLQEGLGYDSVRAGLAFIPLTATFLLVNVFGSRFAGRYGARWPMVTGAGVAALGFALLVRLDGVSRLADMALPFALIPAGMGFAIPALYTGFLSAVDRDLSGIASAVLNAARQAGGVIGVAVFGALAGARGTIVAGLHASALIAAGLIGALTVLTWVVLRPQADPAR